MGIAEAPEALRSYRKTTPIDEPMLSLYRSEIMGFWIGIAIIVSSWVFNPTHNQGNRLVLTFGCLLVFGYLIIVRYMMVAVYQMPKRAYEAWELYCWAASAKVPSETFKVLSSEPDEDGVTFEIAIGETTSHVWVPQFKIVYADTAGDPYLKIGWTPILSHSAFDLDGEPSHPELYLMYGVRYPGMPPDWVYIGLGGPVIYYRPADTSADS